MPFFTGYRRSREPEGSGHPSSQVAGASSSSSPAARPAPLLPEQNEMPGSTSEVTMTWNFDALNEGQQVILSNGPGQENAVIVSPLNTLSHVLLINNHQISLEIR